VPQPCPDLPGVAAARQSAAIFVFLLSQPYPWVCGALPRRRYGEFALIEPPLQPVLPQPLRKAETSTPYAGLSPIEAEREGTRTTALSFALWLRKTLC
jgi:hypothetical protein